MKTIKNQVAVEATIAERDAGERADGLTTDERAELTALRKENAQLKRANEVL
ncbi:hypothetical protein O1M07_45685 [Streptomyces albulus]|nr:hypothetical protein [Streptomyces noursei]MCZ1021270.1 hypothetical protein [Streptomyces noursei]GGX54868.1 hypothetical protein GCM10010341_89880 [Streptomyces noursei]